MQKGFMPPWFGRAQSRLDKLLFALSIYAMPVLITLASLVALLFWLSQYPASDGKQLEFRVVQAHRDLSPSSALTKLGGVNPVLLHDSHLSEDPFWLSFTVDGIPDKETTQVELPSRHAVNVSCWDAQTLQLLGRSDRRASEGSVSRVKAGFALSLGEVKGKLTVLCQTNYVGPARITLVQWPTSQLQTNSDEFHRNSGLLDGGLIVLSLFILITALINRNKTYLLFAVWLVLNLRMAALSSGWDSQWLGHVIPQEVISVTRLFTIAAYFTVTVTLFKTLLQDELVKVGHEFSVSSVQWACIPLMVLSVVLPYRTFLPVLWVVTALGIGIGTFALIRILMFTRSRVAVWYTASIGITLFAGLYEVIAAALGLQGLIGSVNSVTAALSSSLLASLAIAEQMRQEHSQWLDAKAEMEHTFEAMPIGLFTLDLQGQFLSANPALMKMLSPSVLEPGSNEWQRYFSEGAWTKLHHLVHTQNDGELEIIGNSLPRLGAKRFLVKATLAREKIEGSLQDVTEKSRAEEDLLFMANNDVLTKVLNRRGIEKVFGAAMAELTPDKPLALAYLDLDRFKLINDLYGHNVGDDVLQQVCGRVEKLLSGGNQIGRVGGDEFVIVMPDLTLPLATLICRGIVDCIGATVFHVGDKAFHVRASIGLIEVSPDTQMKDAVSTADRACREAKGGSGEGLVVYEKGAKAFQEHEAEIKLVERLATPSATDALFIVMQPIMSLTAPHESLNFEVLLRMRDEDGQLIPTDRLITAAEHSGRMSMIDRWVLSTTLAWLNTNTSRLSNTKFVCMNLSGASLNDEKFMQEVFDMLAQNLHVVRHLCIEITEGVALHDLDNTAKFIEKVRSFGAKVALDDFGAGYTSFSYLKKLTADLLKIDGSFIVNMNSHPANIAIVEAIVNLAGNLGMKVIAEWAEDSATVQTLTEIGVDYVQGYVVARPQDPEMMLTASSSASFIQDEQLAHYVRMIGQSDTAPVIAGAFDTPSVKNVH
jgi:diguanylate cyclase (GGDEF)-like protein